MFRVLPCIAGAFFLAACSSSDGSGPGAAGGTSTSMAGAGNGGAAAAGGSGVSGGNAAGANAGGGANTGAVRGAVSVNIQAPTGCALAAQTDDFPSLMSGHPVSADMEGQGVADQELDSSGAAASVSCTWFSDTSPYMIDGHITLGPTSNQRVVDIGPQLVVGAPSPGGLVVQSKDPDSYGANCNFSIIKLDVTTHSVWGSFSCDSLTDAMNSPTGCTVGPSYFFFDNCTKP